ncbi:SDR family NAD(P)-dependent oxidoreductase [Altererythrobacter sp. C41]|uniref:SDR family NAD(P)-dependent oxidoreductase n=1 Tax=Altererythrobacter sp. C41 TaxID=2806021 RepID=UPI0019349A35|nr:SDR family NAD(P)-dependent oxidoreductase [Altererythrobacter sp. C41]
MSRRWLITGVSGGLGRAIAKGALARGDSVVGTLRSGAEEFEMLAPGRSHAVQLDVSRLGDIPAAVQTAATRLGGIDVLVNNAGYCLAGAVEEIDDAEANEIFAVNFFAPLAVMRAALPYLRTATPGRIINISSLAAVESYPGLGLYCASKAGLSALSDTLAIEVQPFGIHVTAVEAGGMRTGFAGRSLRKAAERLPIYEPMRSKVEDAFRASDGRQANDPEAIADAVLELSDLSLPPTRVVLGQAALERAEAALGARRELYRSYAATDGTARPAG